ncbi:YppD family protein [Bacillus subtilis]
MSGYVCKTDIFRMLSDIEDELTRAEQSLNHSVNALEAEMRETENDRLSMLEEEIIDLHICINELYQSPEHRYAFEKVYRIG